MAHSKRYRALAEKIDPIKTLPMAEALAFVKEQPVKFDAGVEVHFSLGIDPKKSEQTVRGVVALPHGTGKSIRVAAFVAPEKEQEARDAGADVIGNDVVIGEIKKSGACPFDVAVATPDVMKKLGPIAKILGTQGLMPNPKTETVGTDVAKMVRELKSGKISFRSDDGGNVHLLVGRVSFDVEHLMENIRAALDAIRRAKPAESKGIYVQRMTVSASMGPGVSVVIE